MTNRLLSLAVLGAALLVSVPVSVRAQEVVDFESNATGSSPEGPGTVHPNLDIRTASGQSRVIAEGIAPVRYTAPNDLKIRNGCIDTPGCFASPDIPCGFGKGFADFGTDTATQHQYSFTFPGIDAVSEFSIGMVDFGDFNPTPAIRLRSAILMAFDEGGIVVDVDELVVEGNVGDAGDACWALPGQPGNYTLKVEASGIARVELQLTGALDPNTAFDDILFKEQEADPDPDPSLLVYVDIHPTSCPNPFNTKSQGVLPVAILGTDELDVTTINPASIRLADQAPMRWAIEDVTAPFEGELDSCAACTTAGPDGFADLTLKFDQAAVAAALGALTDGACVVLELTGNLTVEAGGTAFTGEDAILVRSKGK